MEHFYQNVPGWFDFGNIYSTMVQLAPDNAHFVELGSWKGKSAAYMCVEIANSGKNIKFDCVDIWTGEGEAYQNDPSVKQQTLYDDFLHYMEPAKGLYTPIKEWSDKAAVHFEDNSLDFVFIDAGHEYENIYADIVAWKPKMKKGGFMGGHDFFSSPGIERAVNELLPGFDTDTSSWIIQIN